jgi:hypothetical protein
VDHEAKQETNISIIIAIQEKAVKHDLMLRQYIMNLTYSLKIGNLSLK